MGEIEKQIFDGGDAALIHSIVEEATEKATLNTLKQLELKRKEKEKNKYDRRLRNTEVLLKNYKNFKYHIECYIYRWGS